MLCILFWIKPILLVLEWWWKEMLGIYEDMIMKNIKIIKGDITKMKADAIVNAANNSLLGGGGVDGAIHRAAGPRLLEECMTLHGCPTGEARITHGYNLPAKYVIHTVGPVYAGKTSDAHMLASCYYNSLALAKKAGLHSVIFSAISTGVYGYPAEDATKIAVDAIEKWQKENSDYKIEISMCAYDNRMYRIYEKMVA